MTKPKINNINRTMEYNILVKPGVVFKEFNDHTLKFLTVLKHCCNKFQRSYRITSANDGKHCATSYHPRNLAWDVGAKEHLNQHRQELLAELKANLPIYFDVVLETFELDPNRDHFHVECDLKKLADWILANGSV